MTRIKHIIRQIFNGTYAIDNKLKYLVICFGVAFVHLFFAVSFGVMHIWGLSIYNIGATLFYITIGIVSNRTGKFFQVFICAIIEVLFHAGIASLILGLDWGFMIYTIALVPLVFYFAYTLPEYEDNIILPVVSSVIVMAWYYLIQVVCRKYAPLYQGGYPEKMPVVFYYFNVMVTFVMLFVFSTLFVLEIRYMKRRLVQENQTLEEIAKFDPLTHLLNRRSMNTYMHQVMEAAGKTEKTFCLIMADIDNFKKINDTYGHDCGDKVLIAIANTISGCVRENDYVCRWGGEEILILVQADLEESYQIAERICHEVASRGVFYKGRLVQVTITMGVAPYEEGGNIRSMVERADKKLYQGKTNGKNQVVK